VRSALCAALVSAVLVCLVQSVPAASVSQPPPSSSASVATAPTERITAYTLSPDLYRKAHFLGRLRFAASVFGVLYGIFVPWLLLRQRWSAMFREWAEAVFGSRFLQGFIYVPLLVLTIGVLVLPLDVLEEAVLKHYGISVQAWRSWIGDWTKMQLLSIVLGTLLGSILYAIFRRGVRHWWILFWLASLPILLFVFFVEPVLIDPMFNRFEPLSDKAPELISDLQRVIRRAGMEIPPERMFWMEASDKTIVPNAYVTGFGASRRIVVWDTTIAQETRDGLLTVFGHELGHYMLGHVWKGLAVLSATGFVLLYLGHRTIGWLLERCGPAWGVRGLDDWASLPALLLLLSSFGFLAGVLGNAYSRYQEHQADVFGFEVTHGIVPDPGQAAALSYQRFGEKAFVDPEPNLIDVLFFFDHPDVASRVYFFVTYDPWAKGESPQFVK
jgi:Zn-dependent protease with chaperone function